MLSHRSTWASALLVAVTAVLAAVPGGQAPPTGTTLDIPYAQVSGRALALNLHMPTNAVAPPLLVWVHGGAWRSGTKASYPKGFIENGIAVASLDFRLSTEARFPAMVHDIKAAVRYLRAHASRFGYQANRIAIGGDSSGAHLAALAGTTAAVPALEGGLGDFTHVSSALQAIVSYYGASNLTTILSQSTPFGLGVRVPALDLLLGGQPATMKALAEQASTVRHVDRSDPPLLLFHGDQDPQMPIEQSRELAAAYRRQGLEVDFVAVQGAVHGGDVFYTGAHLDRAVAFLRKTLGSR